MEGEENKEKIPLKERKINDGQSSNASVNGDNAEDECQSSLFSKRYIISILALLGFCNVYALRVNLSVALVAMVTNSTVSNSEGKNDEVCNSFLFSVRQLKIIIRYDPVQFHQDLVRHAVRILHNPIRFFIRDIVRILCNAIRVL